MPLAVAALTFLLVVALIAGITWSFEGTRRVRQRLVTGPGAGFGVEADLLRTGAAGRGLGGEPTKSAFYDRLARLTEQAGYPGRTNDVLLYIGGCALLGLLLGWLRTGGLLWGIGAAVVVGAAPIVFLAWKRGKRMQQFEAQFPDGLDAMARAIRAGNALSTAVQLVAEEMPNPIGGEFRRVFEETQLGLDPGDALSRLAERTPTDDVRFFCTAVAIQRSSGGNLAEILDRLSEVIRERFRILSHARALSAQHRWSAICVGLSPLVFAVMLELMNPGYFAPMMESPLAPLLLGAGFVMEAIGFFMVWRIAQIKV
jgi:tight adherence protein B